MHSHSPIEVSHTPQITTPTGIYSLDMSSAAFRSTVDLGVACVGQLTVRATLFQQSKWVDLEIGDPVLECGGELVADYIAQQEMNPAMAQAMERMRRKIGTAISNRPRSGLAALRFKAGLSQQQLADRMETQQPNIARWERHPEQMTVLTIRKLAHALEIDAQELFLTIENFSRKAVSEHETA